MSLQTLKDNGTFVLEQTLSGMEVFWIAREKVATSNDSGAEVGGVVSVFTAHSIMECVNWVRKNNLTLVP